MKKEVFTMVTEDTEEEHFKRKKRMEKKQSLSFVSNNEYMISINF